MIVGFFVSLHRRLITRYLPCLILCLYIQTRLFCVCAVNMQALGRQKPKRQRMNGRLRNKFEPFYADDDQAKSTNFWPSVGLMATKRQIAVKPLPPIGMNVLNRNIPVVAWNEPVNVNGLRDWVEQACAANAALMLSEFRQENAIRYALASSDFDIMLHNAIEILPVKASIFFGTDVIRFGSWSFYCKLLVYMHENGYNLHAIDGAVDWSKRAHLLMFMSSHLPLSYLSMYRHVTVDDKDELTGKLMDCMYMFVAVRTALFGIGQNNEMNPDEQYIGEMVMNTDSNSVVRLQETLRLSGAAKFICAAPLSARMNAMFVNSWEDELNPRVLLDMLKFAERVPLLRRYNDARRARSSDQVMVQNFDVLNVTEDAFLNAVRPIVLRVFGSRPWWDVSFSMRDERGELDLFELDRLSKAVCLLQLAYGSRYVGVLLYNKITPIRDYLIEDGVGPRDYSILDESVRVIMNLRQNDDAKLAITNISKQNKEFSARYLMTDLFDAPFILDDEKDKAHDEMQPDMPESVHVYIFFMLLRAVRDAVFDIFSDIDITWNHYNVHINGGTIHGIKYIDKRDEDTLLIRKMKSFLYTYVNNAAKSIEIEGMPNITTHDLRRLYGAYAYFKYAKHSSMDKNQFIRATFSHDSDSARYYTMVSITGKQG